MPTEAHCNALAVALFKSAYSSRLARLVGRMLGLYDPLHACISQGVVAALARVAAHCSPLQPAGEEESMPKVCSGSPCPSSPPPPPPPPTHAPPPPCSTHILIYDGVVQRPARALCKPASSAPCPCPPARRPPLATPPPASAYAGALRPGLLPRQRPDAVQPATLPRNRRSAGRPHSRGRGSS